MRTWWNTCSEYYNTADAAAHAASLENKHVDGTVLRPPGMPPMRTRADTPFNPRSSTARSSTVAGNSSTVVDASESTTDGEWNRRQSKYGDRIKPQETGRMGKDLQAEWTPDKPVTGGRAKSAAAAAPKRKPVERETQLGNTQKTQRNNDRPKPPSRPPQSSSHADHSGGRRRMSPPIPRGSIAESSGRSPSQRSPPAPPGEVWGKLGKNNYIRFKIPPMKRPSSTEDSRSSRSPSKRRRRTDPESDSWSKDSAYTSEFDEQWDTWWNDKIYDPLVPPHSREMATISNLVMGTFYVYRAAEPNDVVNMIRTHPCQVMIIQMERGTSAVAEAVKNLQYDSDFRGDKPWTKNIKIVSGHSVVVTGPAVASCWLDVPAQNPATADTEPIYYQVHIKLQCDTEVTVGVVQSHPGYKKRLNSSLLTAIHESIIFGRVRALTGVFGRSANQMTPLLRSLPLATEILYHKWRRISKSSVEDDELTAFPAYTVLIGHASKCSLPEDHEWVDEKAAHKNMWAYPTVAVKQFLPDKVKLLNRQFKAALGMDDCEWGQVKMKALKLGDGDAEPVKSEKWWINNVHQIVFWCGKSKSGRGEQKKAKEQARWAEHQQKKRMATQTRHPRHTKT